MPAHDIGASTRKPPAAILSLPDLINHARTRTHARALMQTHARARARTHIHAHALTHTHTYRHIYIYIGRERDTRAHGQSRSRFDRSTCDSCIILSLSQSRRTVPTRSARQFVAPARARGVWDGVESKLADGLAQRCARETKRRDPGRADAARRSRRGCAPLRHASIIWRLLRVTSARSGRGVHGLRAAARAQARLCSCDRRDVVWASIASASRRGLFRRMAADAARAHTHGPQRHAHSTHDVVLLAWCRISERVLIGSPAARKSICVCHAHMIFLWL